MSQSRKVLRIFFSKFGFLCFSRLNMATCSRVEGPVARGTQRFSWLSLRLSREWNFQLQKTLRKFLKSFLSSVLAAGPSDLHATYVSRENRMFCTKWVSFLNFFSFPSNISDCSSPSLPEHSQTHRISLKQTSILNHIILKSSRKKV